MTIQPSKLFRLTSPRVAIMNGLEVGAVVWLYGNRRSSLGGYIGSFGKTYPHKNAAGEVVGYSPNRGHNFQAHMDAVEEMPNFGPLRFAHA